MTSPGSPVQNQPEKLGSRRADSRILTRPDLVAATSTCSVSRRAKARLDDIDHLGSRRVRTIGRDCWPINAGWPGPHRSGLVKERNDPVRPGRESMSPQKLHQSQGSLRCDPGFLRPQPMSQFMDRSIRSPIDAQTAVFRPLTVAFTRPRRVRSARRAPVHYAYLSVETPEGPTSV